MSPDELHAWIDELAALFGNAPWVWVMAKIAMVVTAVGVTVNGVISVWSKLQGPVERFRALFFDAARRQRVVERQLFAKHLEWRIKQLNEFESWDDNRFAELEAEVEAPSPERRLAWLPRMRLPILRRQRLSRALERSSARLILLQGEPGSGKSVALRRVALSMARKGAQSRSDLSRLPIYINLKGLQRKLAQEIDRNLIEDFVRRQLTGSNRDVNAYLDREFDAGMRAGQWVFLFDSFDELPDILGSTDADVIVTKYADAIYEFLHGMNCCRGVIASRLFRGPKAHQGTEFRITPLDRARRLELLERANLEPGARRELRAWMDGAELQRELASPMLVSMLCAQAKDGFTAPRSAHDVYEDYIQRLFKRDARRLDERFGVPVDELRTFAEKIAFYMTAEGLGLEPTTDALISILIAHEGLVRADIENALRALAYMKLAKISDGEDARTFTFSHRRIQEFFSTCVLLRDIHRVEARTLLTNAAWRESTVVLLQTSAADTLDPLLREIDALLREAVERLSGQTLEHSEGYDWPPGARHLCSIIQDGLRSRRELLADETRSLADSLIEDANRHGTHLDRKWSLEVAGACSDACVALLLSQAFDSGSVLLADAAFWRLHELTKIPPDVANSVSSRFLAWAEEGVLERERHKLAAYVARTPLAEEWGATIQLLALMRIVMVSLNGMLLVAGLAVLGPSLPLLVAACSATIAVVRLWSPVGAIIRPVAAFAWLIAAVDQPLWGLWLTAAILFLSWDWSARAVVRFGLSDTWPFRVCPWLWLPFFGAVLVSMLELRALGKWLLVIAGGVLGLFTFMWVIIGVGLGLVWIENALSDHAPLLLTLIGGGLQILLYVGGGLLLLALGLFMAWWMWDSTSDYLRFVRTHRLARRGGVSSIETLRELLGSINSDERRVRIVEVVREHRTLSPTRETIVELRKLEHEAAAASAQPALQDAYARLAENLIDRRSGAGEL